MAKKNQAAEAYAPGSPPFCPLLQTAVCDKEEPTMRKKEQRNGGKR